MSEEVRAKHYDVFVSYKRRDDAAREVLCRALQEAGFEPWWDAKLGQGDFREQLRDEINRCDLVIGLWSANAHAEPAEVMMEMAHAFGVKKLLAVKIDAAPVPRQLAKENFLPFDGWADAKRGAEQVAHILAEARKLGAKPSLTITKPVATTIPVDLGDLPAAPDKLIGREREMKLLRDAWHNGTNAVVLWALGGAGKSALLRAFVNERLAKGGDCATRIYGWSAYSQGSGEQKRADADGFISRALADFGYTGEPIKDAVERARTLAKLIQKERVLLLLDGLEPLQDPPNLNKGRFKDKGLAALVKALGNQNPGMMVLTSRQEVPELEGAGNLVVHHELDVLSDEAGADLLVELGVKGRPRELKAAVHELGGHALSVTLLGTYLTEVCGGDIHQKDRFKFGDVILTPEEEENADKTVRYAKRAEKVMAGYLEQFDKLAEGKGSAGLGGPERALLHVLGLFDRPADGPAIDMLLRERIHGLTDDLFVERVVKTRWLGLGRTVELRELSPDERSARLREAKARLRKLKLLAKADATDPHGLDAHPVVRAFFSVRLDAISPDASRTAHEKLHYHYSEHSAEFPQTLHEMQPLFYAIRHGVKANFLDRCFSETFRRRLCRSESFYIGFTLGAFGPLLSVLNNFYDGSWKTPSQALNYANQASARGIVALALAAQGRHKEAAELREYQLTEAMGHKQWKAAVSSAGELAMARLDLGDLAGAEDAMNVAVIAATESNDPKEIMEAQAVLANILAAKGREAEAYHYFDRVVPEFTDTSLDLDNIFSACSFIDLQFYREFLSLHRKNLIEFIDARLADVGENVFAGDFSGRYSSGYFWLLITTKLEPSQIQHIEQQLNRSVEELRSAGFSDATPQALLARAAHRRKRVAAGEKDLLQPLLDDLAEVEDIAQPEMRLYLTDLALECARVALDIPWAFDTPEQARAEAIRHTAEAAQLIADTGYHRRDGELAELHKRLAAVS